MRLHAETSTSNCEQSLLINQQVISKETHYILDLSVEFTFPLFSVPPPLHLPLPCRLISNQFLSPAHKYSPERSWPFLSGGRQLGMRKRVRVLDEPRIYLPLLAVHHTRKAASFVSIYKGGNQFNKYICFID